MGKRQGEYEPPKCRGLIPPKRRPPLPGDDPPEFRVPEAAQGPPAPAPSAEPGSRSPRFYRDARSALLYAGDCPGCHVHGTLYFRVRFGSWRCQHCGMLFPDGYVTGDFGAIQAAFDEMKQALRQASELTFADDFEAAAESLVAVGERCLREAEFIFERERELREKRGFGMGGPEASPPEPVEGEEPALVRKLKGGLERSPTLWRYLDVKSRTHKG